MSKGTALKAAKLYIYKGTIYYVVYEDTTTGAALQEAVCSSTMCVQYILKQHVKIVEGG